MSEAEKYKKVYLLWDLHNAEYVEQIAYTDREVAGARARELDRRKPKGRAGTMVEVWTLVDDEAPKC